ncbi:hypothetical protein TrST_g2632 [Triparma strigata]|nr:hypothetical protein TrST_g2632 [Triparma strigata]
MQLQKQQAHGAHEVGSVPNFFSGLESDESEEEQEDENDEERRFNEAKQMFFGDDVEIDSAQELAIRNFLKEHGEEDEEEERKKKEAKKKKKKKKKKKGPVSTSLSAIAGGVKTNSVTITKKKEPVKTSPVSTTKKKEPVKKKTGSSSLSAISSISGTTAGNGNKKLLNKRAAAIKKQEELLAKANQEKMQQDAPSSPRVTTIFSPPQKLSPAHEDAIFDPLSAAAPPSHLLSSEPAPSSPRVTTISSRPQKLSSEPAPSSTRLSPSLSPKPKTTKIPQEPKSKPDTDYMTDQELLELGGWTLAKEHRNHKTSKHRNKKDVKYSVYGRKVWEGGEQLHQTFVDKQTRQSRHELDRFHGEYLGRVVGLDPEPKATAAAPSPSLLPLKKARGKTDEEKNEKKRIAMERRKAARANASEKSDNKAKVGVEVLEERERKPKAEEQQSKQQSDPPVLNLDQTTTKTAEAAPSVTPSVSSALSAIAAAGPFSGKTFSTTGGTDKLPPDGFSAHVKALVNINGGEISSSMKKTVDCLVIGTYYINMSMGAGVKLDIEKSSKYAKAIKLKTVRIISLKEFEELVEDPNLWSNLKLPVVIPPPSSPSKSQSKSKKKSTEEMDPCVICFEPGLYRCTNCKVHHYCSKECQMKDWELGHKAQCKIILKEQKERDEEERLRKEKEEEDERIRKKLAKEKRQRQRQREKEKRIAAAIKEKGDEAAAVSSRREREAKSLQDLYNTNEDSIKQKLLLAKAKKQPNGWDIIVPDDGGRTIFQHECGAVAKMNSSCLPASMRYLTPETIKLVKDVQNLLKGFNSMSEAYFVMDLVPMGKPATLSRILRYLEENDNDPELTASEVLLDFGHGNGKKKQAVREVADLIRTDNGLIVDDPLWLSHIEYMMFALISSDSSRSLLNKKSKFRGIADDVTMKLENYIEKALFSVIQPHFDQSAIESIETVYEGVLDDIEDFKGEFDEDLIATRFEVYFAMLIIRPTEKCNSWPFCRQIHWDPAEVAGWLQDQYLGDDSSERVARNREAERAGQAAGTFFLPDDMDDDEIDYATESGEEDEDDDDDEMPGMRSGFLNTSAGVFTEETAGTDARTDAGDYTDMAQQMRDILGSGMMQQQQEMMIQQILGAGMDPERLNQLFAKLGKVSIFHGLKK